MFARDILPVNAGSDCLHCALRLVEADATALGPKGGYSGMAGPICPAGESRWTRPRVPFLFAGDGRAKLSRSKGIGRVVSS